MIPNEGQLIAEMIKTEVREEGEPPKVEQQNVLYSPLNEKQQAVQQQERIQHIVRYVHPEEKFFKVGDEIMPRNGSGSPCPGFPNHLAFQTMSIIAILNRDE